MWSRELHQGAWAVPYLTPHSERHIPLRVHTIVCSSDQVLFCLSQHLVNVSMYPTLSIALIAVILVFSVALSVGANQQVSQKDQY